jgi:imidazolonepropionase-like amidohydrolase
MDRDAALRAVTLTPAEILGVADRVGSLTPGKDADLSVYDGDPMDITGKAWMVVLNGKVVFKR